MILLWREREKGREKCPGAVEIAKRGAQPMTSGSQVAGSWWVVGTSGGQVLALPWSWRGVPAGTSFDRSEMMSSLELSKREETGISTMLM